MQSLIGLRMERMLRITILILAFLRPLPEI